MTEQPKNTEEAIFLAALEKATLQEREVFVEEACAGDQFLLMRVRVLLDSHDDSKGPLDFPPGAVQPTIIHPITEQPGTRIGSYRLLQQIGEGGFGVVYLAEQSEPVRRKVALKIIKPGMDTKEVVARFEAERQALALMDHPNVAKVFDGGTTESGRPFFVMELVKGVPITEFCDANRLPMSERLQLFTTVCRAVQHAHQKGVIHRDLKPSNVMVTLHDGRPVPKVIDFGVSKAISQRLTDKTLFTAYGQMVGTPAYMSPEQAEMSGLDIDTRSDVYSLGVLLYELLTGVTPLEADNLRGAAYVEMQRIIREVVPQKPSTRLSTLGEATASIAACRGTEPKKLGSLVRGDLDWIVMHALEKDRERRYESANSFASDVERFLNREAVEACPPSLTYKFRSYIRRNKHALIVAGTIQGLLFIGIFVSVILAIRMINERDRANSAELLARNRLTEIEKEQKNTREALIEVKNERNRAVKAERQEALRRQEVQRQKDEADQQRRKAEHQARNADARRLAARSREAMHEQPDLSLLLAAEALETSWRHDEPHVPVAEQTLRDALATVGGTPLNRQGTITRIVTMTSTWIVTSDDQATHLFNLSAAAPSAQPLHLNGERALSRRGRNWLVTIDRENILRVRDLSTPKPRAMSITRKHTDKVATALVSPNGRWLAITAGDSISRLWNLATREKQQVPHVLTGHKSWAISSDSRWLATTGGNGDRVHLWDLAADDPTDKPLQLEMRGQMDELHHVEFGPKGRWLVAGSRNRMDTRWDNQRRLVWDLKSDKPAKQLMLLDGTSSGRWGNELFSPDGRWLLLARHGESTLWDMHEQDPDVSPITLRLPHMGGMAVFSPDSNILVIGNRTWNLADEQIAQRPRGSRDANALRVVMHRAVPTLIQHEWSTCMAFDPEMRWGARALADNRIGIWDLTQISTDPTPLSRESFALRGHSDPITSLEFSSDGRWLLSEGAEGTVRLWDFARNVPGAAPATLRGETAVSLSPDGRWLTTTRSPKSAKLWDLAAADPSLTPMQLTGHTSTLREATFSPNSRWLVTVDNDLNMQMWDLTSDDPSSAVSLFLRDKSDFGRGVGWLFAMKFSADSRWLYAAPGKDARLWDLSAKKPGSDPLVFEGHARVPMIADFSANGRWLVTADGKKACLWDLTADDPTANPVLLGEQQGDLSFAEFDAESRRLITFTHGANAPRLWDLRAVNPVITPIVLSGHDGAVRNRPVLSPDRRWLATSGKDKKVRVWKLREQISVDPLVLHGGSEVTALHFTPNSRWLLGSADEDNRTHIWDLAATDPSASATVAEGFVWSISPDSRWFVAGKTIWSLQDAGLAPMPITLGQSEEPWRAVEFSGDGRRLAIYGHNKVQLFDLSHARPNASTILLTGALGKHTHALPRRSLELLKSPFSADGRWLVTTGYTGGNETDTLLFNLRVRELARLARQIAGRDLTEQEGELFLLKNSE